MRVKEIMNTEVRTIAPDRSLTEASELMRIRGIRHLPVLEHGRIVGVISNRDLAALTHNELGQVKVRDVMEHHVVSIEPEASIAQAANRMRAHSIGCLPVIEEGKLKGIVTITDMLEHIGRTSRQERTPNRDGRKSRRHAHA